MRGASTRRARAGERRREQLRAGANPHYQARNVYFQFGHKADLFQNSAFTTLFWNAIRWASER
jgi:hypothetical protein